MVRVESALKKTYQVRGVADLIRAGRTRKGLSIRQVAERSGIGRSTISRWERQTAEPSGPELQSVLRVIEPSDPVWIEPALFPTFLVKRPHTFRGDLLRALRLQKGWTIQSSADAIGVSKAAFSRWENSQRAPHLQTIERILDLWQVSSADRAEILEFPQESGRLALDDVQEALLRVQEEIRAPNSRPLDIEFLNLIAQIENLDSSSRSVKLLHAQAMAAYVTWLGWWYRDREAYAWTNHARQQGLVTVDASSYCRFQRAQRIYLAEYLHDDRKAASLLLGVFEHAGRSSAQGVLLRETAGFYLNLGRTEEAMAVLRLARDSQPPDESQQIHQICCDILEANIWILRRQPERSLSLLPENPTKDSFLQVSVVASRAEAYRKLRCDELANETLIEQARLFELKGLTHFARTLRKRVVAL